MSLKTFHIIFIIFSVILSLGYGGWAIFFYFGQGQKIYLIMGIISFVFAVALIIYGAQFLKKINAIDVK